MPDGTTSTDIPPDTGATMDHPEDAPESPDGGLRFTDWVPRG